MRDAQAVIDGVRHGATAMTVGGGGAAAGFKATEQSIIRQYPDGSFLQFLSDNAIVIGIGIAAAGLLLHFAGFIVSMILKFRSAKKKDD